MLLADSTVVAWQTDAGHARYVQFRNLQGECVPDYCLPSAHQEAPSGFPRLRKGLLIAVFFRLIREACARSSSVQISKLDGEGLTASVN